MLVKDKVIEIEINSKNISDYRKTLNNDKLKLGQLISLEQENVPSKSNLKVECSCDKCGKLFKRMRSSVREYTLCSKECRDKFLGLKNPNPKKPKIPVKCDFCKNIFEVHESKFKKQKNFFCSKDCYYEFRKQNYNKDKIYNYQNSFIECSLSECNNKIKTSKWYEENRKHQFCSPECYWKHRSDKYKEFYYKDSLNDYRNETNPERKVREYLGNKKIRFKQEAGFLKKYYVDFYLKDYKVIIEVFGDYWHVNPRIYDINNNDSTKRKLTLYQKQFIESKYDENRIKELESYGYNVFVIWEDEINDDLEIHMNNIIKLININS